MSTVLDRIVDGVLEDLAERQAAVPLPALYDAAAAAPPALDPLPGFRRPGSRVIAEVKRQSPSKGHLAAIPDPGVLAAAYERGGAAAVSVLTERRRFGGSLADLRAVRAAVGLPVLRKDFVVTSYQLVEARAAGADLVLLIVAALPDQRLPELYAEARDLGLSVLVEVHDEAETARAVDLGAELVGVNARNLKTLAVDPDTFGRLAPLLGPEVVKVAESGITGPDEVTDLVVLGADVVLVGEALVRDGDPESACRSLTGLGLTSLGVPVTTGRSHA